MLRQVAGKQRPLAQQQHACVAVRDHADAGQALLALQGARHLRGTVFMVVEHHGLHARAQRCQDGVQVLQAAVNKNDFAQGGGCGEVHIANFLHEIRLQRLCNVRFMLFI